MVLCSFLCNKMIKNYGSIFNKKKDYLLKNEKSLSPTIMT